MINRLDKKPFESRPTLNIRKICRQTKLTMITGDHSKRNFFLCGICLISLIMMLVMSGLGIALLVKYLKRNNHDNDFDMITVQTKTIAMGYASNCSMCRNGYLSNQDSVDQQLTIKTGLYGSRVRLDSAVFIAAVARNRRSASSTQNSLRCERATGLTGDIFAIRVQFTYPVLCYSSSCRQEYDQTIRTAFRKSRQGFPIHVELTDGQSRDVELKFCSFHTIIR